MRLLLSVFLLMFACTVFADESNQWRTQSYAQSKQLPDLHHAVDVKLLEKMNPPAEFLLKEGRVLQCQTCHGLEKIDEIPYDKIDKNALNFLRLNGYQKLDTFCTNCHDAKQHERPNIHLMKKEDGSIKKETCLFCHREVNDKRDVKRELVDANLRLPVETVCVGCHLKTPHFNAVEHTDGTLSEDTSSSAKKMTSRLKQIQQEKNSYLPLSSDNKILCITCHNPHEEGILGENNPSSKQVQGDVKKGVEYSEHSWSAVMKEDKRERLEKIAMSLPVYKRIEKEVLLRLPAKDGTLCLSCHEFEN